MVWTPPPGNGAAQTFVKGCKVDEQKHGEYDEMQTRQGFWQSLVVSGQPADALSLPILAPPSANKRRTKKSYIRMRVQQTPADGLLQLICAPPMRLALTPWRRIRS